MIVYHGMIIVVFFEDCGVHSEVRECHENGRNRIIPYGSWTHIWARYSRGRRGENATKVKLGEETKMMKKEEDAKEHEEEERMKKKRDGENREGKEKR
jgi:hypothetical protein